MAYNYEEQRKELFTDEGQRRFLRMRDKVLNMLKTSGACRPEALMLCSGMGDDWQCLACFDRMLELGEVREITYDINCVSQHRIFVKN